MNWNWTLTLYVQIEIGMIFLNIIFIYIFHFNYLYNIFIKPRYVLQIPRKDKIALLRNWGWGAFPRQMWKYTNDTEVYLMQLLINSLINYHTMFWNPSCEEKEVLLVNSWKLICYNVLHRSCCLYLVQAIIRICTLLFNNYHLAIWYYTPLPMVIP